MKRAGIEKLDSNVAELNRRCVFQAHHIHMYRYLKSVFVAVKQAGSVPSNPNHTLHSGQPALFPYLLLRPRKEEGIGTGSPAQ